MKKEIIAEILKNLNAKPLLKKKLKMYATVGIIGFFLILTLTVWAGISVFNYTLTKAKETIQSPSVSNNIKDLKTEMNGMPKLQALSCWSAAQSLIAVQPWLDKSVSENLAKLKNGCLKLPNEVCESVECNNLKKLMNTVGGETI